MRKIPEIPHQRFTEASDFDVHDDVLSFHTKGVYALCPGMLERAYLTLLSSDDLNAMIRKDVAFVPGLYEEIEIGNAQESINPVLKRAASAISFENTNELGFHILAGLLKSALCADSEGRRPYPSGGALYPIETYLCRTSDACVEWPRDGQVLRLRPVASSFEVVRKHTRCEEVLGALSGFDAQLGSPHFALVYAIHLDRAIFKYRYRGYRFAMMEIGSMYEICGLHGTRLGLDNRVWGGFNDYAVAQILGVNPANVLPCAVQFFGLKGI